LKVFLKDNDGKEIELKEIETLNKDCDVVFFMLNRMLRQEEIERYEKYMTDKVGKKCIAVDCGVNKILSV
jgi:hypothetical protein